MKKTNIKQLALLGLTNGFLLSTPSAAFGNEKTILTLENLTNFRSKLLRVVAEANATVASNWGNAIHSFEMWE